MFYDKVISAINGTDCSLFDNPTFYINKAIENDRKETEILFDYGKQAHQFLTSLFLLTQHRDNYKELLKRFGDGLSVLVKKGKDGEKKKTFKNENLFKNVYLPISNYIFYELNPKIDELKHLIGNRKKYNEQVMSARNGHHFKDDKSLELQITSITKSIELKQTTDEIIALLKDEQAINDLVLDDNQERYFRHLNGRIHTHELEEEDGNIKWFHDLASRHKDYKDFLDAQLKIFIPTPSNIDPIGKPWEAHYRIVCKMCKNFDVHLPILVDAGYIIIDNSKQTFAWNKKKASLKVMAKYFKLIKKKEKGEEFWRHIVFLFGLAPIDDINKIDTTINNLTQYASRKYTSDSLDTLEALLGLNNQ